MTDVATAAEREREAVPGRVDELALAGAGAFALWVLALSLLAAACGSDKRSKSGNNGTKAGGDAGFFVA